MKNSFLKTGKEIISNVDIVDSETGELLGREIETKRITYLANTQEEFYLMYSSILGLMQKMTQADVRVFAWLMSNYKSLISMNTAVYSQIAEDCNIALGSVRNAMTSLKDKKLIYPIKDNSYRNYRFNPRYVFKGSSKDRHKMLQFILENECIEC